MAFARTPHAEAGGASGTLEFLQVDGFITVGQLSQVTQNPCTARFQGPGGAASYNFRQVTDPTPPLTVYTYLDAVANTSTGSMGVATAQMQVNPTPPPPAIAVFTVEPPETISQAVSTAETGLYVYKRLFRSNYDHDALSSPCHPLHGTMVYAWGNPDGYDKTITTPLASWSQSGYTLTPSISLDANGEPIPHTGTTDRAGVTVTLGMSGPPTGTITGDVARWVDLAYNGEPLDFSGFSASGPGWSAAGSGDTVTLTLDGTAISGAGFDVSASVDAPVNVNWDLVGYDFDTPYSGLVFVIPADDGVGTQNVSSAYASSVVYQSNSWASNVRVWSGAPTVGSAWAAANDEVTDLTALRCIIRERGLSGAVGDWRWGGFDARRIPSLSVQDPDGTGVLPSAWVHQDALVSVAQVAAQTTITVAGAAAASAVRRTLEEDYFGYKVTAAGLTTVGMPTAYQQTKRASGDDIWHWGCYKALRITYSSDVARTATLRLSNSTYDPADDHMSGTERITNSVAGGVRTQTEYTWPLTFAATAGAATAEVIVDLATPDSGGDDPWLFHIDWVQLEDLVGDGLDRDLVIEDIELLAYSHSQATETGRFDAKAVYPREASVGGLPTCYTGLTTTCDGSRSIMPPDQVVTLLGEAGLDFCAKSRGRTTGVIMDALHNLSYWMGLLQETEGIEVAGGGGAYSLPGAAQYDSAFVDGDGNDMLGSMKAADVVEVFDDTIPTGATGGDIETAVHCGKVLFCASVPGGIDVRVRKHLRGSIHGPAREASGARPGPGATVTLWEWDGLSWSQVGAATTDNWDRYRFSTGYREAHSGLAVYGASAPTSGGLTTHDKLRRWLQVVVGATEVPCRSTDRAGHWNGSAWFVGDEADGAGGFSVVGQYSPNGGAARLTQEVLLSGRCPCAQPLPDGTILLLWATMSGGAPEVRWVTWDGAEWSVETVLLPDIDCPAFDTSAFESRLYVAGLQEQASGGTYDLLYWRGAIVGGVPVLVDSVGLQVAAGVDKARPTIKELPDRSLQMVYETGGGMAFAVSHDGGITWEAL